MKLTPMAPSAQIPTVNGARTSSPTLDTARARAIALVQGTSGQEHPVRNPSQVAPEEMTAISTPTRRTSEVLVESHTEAPAETAAPQEATSPETSKPLSSEYAILARKERALRMREEQIKAREAALKAPKAPETPAFDPSKYISREQLAKDPFSALNEVGVTYDQLTNAAMNQPSAEQVAYQNEMRALKAELEELKKGQDGVRKNFEEQQAESYKQAVSQIRNDVRSIVVSDPTFETIKATGSINDVVELIEETFRKDGILLSAEEAAIEVENYLVEEALKLSRLSKIQQRLSASSSAPKQTQAPQSGAKPSTQPMKTLTNAVGATRQLSARERALLAFKGEKAS